MSVLYFNVFIYSCGDNFSFRVPHKGSIQHYSIIPHFFYINYITEVPCVSNVVVSTDSPSQLSIIWDQSTVLCLADEFQVEYEIMNEDQCDTDPSSPIVIPWQGPNFATLTELKLYSTYRIVVTPSLTVGLSSRNVGERVETMHTTGTTGMWFTIHSLNLFLNE